MIQLFIASAMFFALALGGQQKKLEALIITGGHSFDREAFFEMFDIFNNIQWTEVTHPEALDLFGSEKIRRFDAVVFYDMPTKIEPTEAQKQNLIRFFREGAPAIFLHHSLVSYPFWDEFPEIIGGRFYNSPHRLANGDSVTSGYQHDVRYTIKVVDPAHPVTRGLADFEIIDEVYNRFYIKDDVQPLLATEHPLSDKVIGWVNRYGKSRVVYLLNGHDKQAYNNENYRRLLQNAIEWVARLHSEK